MKLLLGPPPPAIIIQNFNFLKAKGWELLPVFEIVHIKGHLKTTLVSFHLTLITLLLSQHTVA
jgi:hypothetical protein